MYGCGVTVGRQPVSVVGGVEGGRRFGGVRGGVADGVRREAVEREVERELDGDGEGGMERDVEEEEEELEEEEHELQHEDDGSVLGKSPGLKRTANSACVGTITSWAGLGAGCRSTMLACTTTSAA